MGDTSRQPPPDGHPRGRNHRAPIVSPIIEGHANEALLQNRSAFRHGEPGAAASSQWLRRRRRARRRRRQDMGERCIYQTAAEAGDPQAQFSPGDSWCWTATKRADNRRHAIYSNEKATEWPCRAALRNYGPAQMELARIYAGRPFRYNVMKQAADRVLGAPKDPAVALMWAEIAEINKVDGAARLRVCLMEEATLAVQIEAAERKVRWQTSPCAWQDIIQQDGDLT